MIASATKMRLLRAGTLLSGRRQRQPAVGRATLLADSADLTVNKRAHCGQRVAERVDHVSIRQRA